MSKISMRDWKKMSPFERHELSAKHVPVCEKVFIEAAKNFDDREERELFVKEYGYYANVTFYADGAVSKTPPGATGFVRAIPTTVAPPDSDKRSSFKTGG